MAALTAVKELRRRRRLGLDLLMTIAAARATVLGRPESWDAVPKLNCYIARPERIMLIRHAW
jgi:hypothetical protein